MATSKRTSKSKATSANAKAAATPKSKSKSPALKTLKQAAAEARRGNTDAALAALRELADAGDAAASASVAELLAFSGEWEEAARRAMVLLAEPDAVYAVNVFEDCAAIVRRASEELRRPSLVEEAARLVPESHAPNRDAVLLADFYRGREAARVAKPDKLADALKLAPTLPRLKGKPDALRRHCFSLAVAFDVDEEILARWDPNDPNLGFDQAIEVARAYARRGQLDEAWQAASSRTFWPVEACQVAPVVLLADFRLAPMMTRARCAEILARPRGPEAAKAKA